MSPRGVQTADVLRDFESTLDIPYSHHLLFCVPTLFFVLFANAQALEFDLRFLLEC